METLGIWMLLLAVFIVGACIVNTTLTFFHMPFGSTTSVTLLLVIICFFVVFVATVMGWAWLVVFKYGFRVLVGREWRSAYRIDAPRDAQSELP